MATDGQLAAVQLATFRASAQAVGNPSHSFHKRALAIGADRLCSPGIGVETPQDVAAKHGVDGAHLLHAQ